MVISLHPLPFLYGFELQLWGAVEISPRALVVLNLALSIDLLRASPCRFRRAQYPINQTTIAGKSSFASLLHGKRRGKAKIDPQRVDVTRQLKRKQDI